MHEFMAPVWAHRTVVPSWSGAGGGGGATKVAARVGYNDKMLSPEEKAVLSASSSRNSEAGEEKGGEKGNILMHYRVWGMTARILIEAARIAYDKKPEFECLEHYGDEDMIQEFWEHGILREERRQGEEHAVKEMIRKGNL